MMVSLCTFFCEELLVSELVNERTKCFGETLVIVVLNCLTRHVNQPYSTAQANQAKQQAIALLEGSSKAQISLLGALSP